MGHSNGLGKLLKLKNIHAQLPPCPKEAVVGGRRQRTPIIEPGGYMSSTAMGRYQGTGEEKYYAFRMSANTNAAVFIGLLPLLEDILRAKIKAPLLNGSTMLASVGKLIEALVDHPAKGMRREPSCSPLTSLPPILSPLSLSHTSHCELRPLRPSTTLGNHAAHLCAVRSFSCHALY